MLHLMTSSVEDSHLLQMGAKTMNTIENKLSPLTTQQAIERIRNELHKIYREALGKEPQPEVLRAEAEELVAIYGPDFELNDLFENFLP